MNKSDEHDDHLEYSARKAAALKYDGNTAPVIIAKGQGAFAEQILAIAQHHGVHLHEDPQLVNTLIQLKLNQEIPRNLYVAIARVIAFAYYLQGKKPDSHR